MRSLQCCGGGPCHAAALGFAAAILRQWGDYRCIPPLWRSVGGTRPGNQISSAMYLRLQCWSHTCCMSACKDLWWRTARIGGSRLQPCTPSRFCGLASIHRSRACRC
jgi:hypothetical protein